MQQLHIFLATAGHDEEQERRHATICKARADPQSQTEEAAWHCCCMQAMMKSWNGGRPTAEFNNAGQAVNHAFYFDSMAPDGGGEGGPTCRGMTVTRQLQWAHGRCMACSAAHEPI